MDAPQAVSANRFQDVFGAPSERARKKVVDTMSEEVQAFKFSKLWDTETIAQNAGQKDI